MLREHYIGNSRPVHNTSIKKADTETVIEYIIRAEQNITALRSAGETASEGLMMAMVMRGLPEKYKLFTHVHGHSWFSGHEAGGDQGQIAEL